MNTIVEDFRASSGERPEPGVDQVLEHLDGSLILESSALRDLLQVDDLDRGEGLDVQLRSNLVDRLQHRGVVIEGQPGVQSAHDVQFGGTRFGSLDGLLSNLIDRVLVGTLVATFPVKGTEGAAEGTDVRVVDVAVDVEPGDVPVHSPSDEVGQCAHRVDVFGLVEKKSVLAGEPGPFQDPVDDACQTLVGGGGDPVGSHCRFSVKHGHLGLTV